jgi:uncharacterized membrane protein YfcA
LADISTSDIQGLLVIAIAVALGGILKGATGAGMPIVAIPVIAAIYDVRIAVIILVFPNFIINMWQAFKYRKHELNRTFLLSFALSGAAGAGLGTLFLVWAPTEFLSLMMAGVVIVYIGLRLLKPAFHISLEYGRKTAWLVGGFGGILQGSLGISAPAAVTFLNAIKLPRPTFIHTVSIFFATMCLVQFPIQFHYGLVTWNSAALSVLALIPLFAGLPIGEWIGKRMSPVVFDRVILTMLAILAIKQIWNVLG